MRRQFDTIYLFVQPAAAVEIWQKDLPQCKGLDEAANLRQFEFLRCKLSGPAPAPKAAALKKVLIPKIIRAGAERAKLSPRETEIVALLAEGAIWKGAAGTLGIWIPHPGDAHDPYPGQAQGHRARPTSCFSLSVKTLTVKTAVPGTGRPGQESARMKWTLILWVVGGMAIGLAGAPYMASSNQSPT